MQVREQELVLSQHLALGQLRFLDLDDHLRSIENFFGRAHNFGAGLFVIGIVHADAETGVGLDENFVAIVHEFVNTGRRHADAKLERFYFFWYSDSHEFSPHNSFQNNKIRLLLRCLLA